VVVCQERITATDHDVQVRKLHPRLHPRLVATDFEDSILLAHSSALDHDALNHPRERDGIYLWHWTSPSPTALGARVLKVDRGVVDEGASCSDPMFWHFSWVRGIAPSGDWEALRTRGGEWDWVAGAYAGILEKVKNWGHHNDRDWCKVIDAVFNDIKTKRVWPTRDFVHGHILVLRPTVPALLIA
jgi:hypothetical protein